MNGGHYSRIVWVVRLAVAALQKRWGPGTEYLAARKTPAVPRRLRDGRE